MSHPCESIRSLRYTRHFVKTVTQFQRVSATPNSFKVKFCLGGRFQEEIDGWVVRAVQSGVRELALNLTCLDSAERQERDEYIARRGNKKWLYCFGSPSLAAALINITDPKLEGLELKSCVLEQSALFNLGRNLNSLKLTNVYLPGGQQLALQAIFSSLKSVSLKRIKNLPPEIRVSSDKLEALSIRHCSVLEEIELASVPNLERFEYNNGTNVAMPGLRFSGAPKLRKVCLLAESSEIALQVLLRSLGLAAGAAVEEVSICGRSASPQTTLIPAFTRLERLKLCLAHAYDFDMRGVSKVLRSFPKVRKLELAIKCEGKSKIEADERWKSEATCVYEHLEEVEMSGFKGLRKEIEFVIDLMKCRGAALKTVTMDAHMRVLKKAERWKKVKEYEDYDVFRFWRKGWGEGKREGVEKAVGEYFSTIEESVRPVILFAAIRPNRSPPIICSFQKRRTVPEWLIQQFLASLPLKTTDDEDEEEETTEDEDEDEDEE